MDKNQPTKKYYDAEMFSVYFLKISSPPFENHMFFPEVMYLFIYYGNPKPQMELAEWYKVMFK